MKDEEDTREYISHLFGTGSARAITKREQKVQQRQDIEDAYAFLAATGLEIRARRSGKTRGVRPQEKLYTEEQREANVPISRGPLSNLSAVRKRAREERATRQGQKENITRTHIQSLSAHFADSKRSRQLHATHDNDGKREPRTNCENGTTCTSASSERQHKARKPAPTKAEDESVVSFEQRVWHGLNAGLHQHPFTDNYWRDTEPLRCDPLIMRNETDAALTTVSGKDGEPLSPYRRGRLKSGNMVRMWFVSSCRY